MEKLVWLQFLNLFFNKVQLASNQRKKKDLVFNNKKPAALSVLGFLFFPKRQKTQNKTNTTEPKPEATIN